MGRGRSAGPLGSKPLGVKRRELMSNISDAVVGTGTILKSVSETISIDLSDGMM